MICNGQLWLNLHDTSEDDPELSQKMKDHLRQKHVSSRGPIMWPCAAKLKGKLEGKLPTDGWWSAKGARR
jgi:hypothetical protein